MVEENNDSKNKEESADKKQESVVIDLRELYKFDPKDVQPDISVVRYSNLAYIQVTARDVYIDFLEMPGIKKDGKVLANGTRIYMGHSAAQKLAETLENVLEQVHSSGKMEIYTVKEEGEKKPKNPVTEEEF